MTHAKKLKKAIRARSARTGESYTAARVHVLAERKKPGPGSRSGVSDASVVKATGHGLDHWFAVLDRFGAATEGHTASAAHLQEAHGVRGWHAQMITVTYERERGLRVRNQSCAGDFQVGVSRAVQGSVEEIVSALTGGRWIDEVDPELSRAFPKPAKFAVKPGAAKLRYRWSGSTVEMRITAKKSGSTIVADNMKLADAAHVERRRAQWRRALDVLRSLLKK